MTAQAVEQNDLACDGCGMTTDLCLSMREDCCPGCTHYPEPEPTVIDEAAVIRAAEGDVGIPLNSDEVMAVTIVLTRRGLTDGEIAERLGGGITTSAVCYWRLRNTRPRPRPAGGWTMTAPTVDTATTTDHLLSKAAQHPSKRVQAAAQRAREAVQKVRDLLAEDAGKAEARERVARLERELRDARAALRGGAPTPLQSAPAVDAKAVRAWAVANGHEIAPIGRVPQSIVEDYQRAQQAVAS